MTTTVLGFTAEVHPTGNLGYSFVVSLKLGAITVREWTVTDSSVHSREGLEQFLAEQFGDLFREAARAQHERAVADEHRMTWGE